MPFIYNFDKFLNHFLNKLASKIYFYKVLAFIPYNKAVGQMDFVHIVDNFGILRRTASFLAFENPVDVRMSS